MKRLIFSFVFVFSCISIKNATKSSKDSAIATWNIIFYIAADNDLNKHGFNTAQTTAEGYIDNPYINVFFMCDGISMENYSTTVKDEASYYKLVNGSLVKIDHKGVMDSGSLASYKTFIDFVIDGYGNADHTALFLWGHGSDLRILKVPEDQKHEQSQGIFLGDFKGTPQGISFDELVEAIKYLAHKLPNNKIDILGLDACSLMKVELAYELKNHVDYLVASQIKQNALSWNYRDVLVYLSKNFKITPRQLVEKIIDAYKYFYEVGIYNSNIAPDAWDNRRNDAISALDVKRIESFHEAFENYIDYLIKFLSTTSGIREKFIQDFKGSFSSVNEEWEYGKILKGSVVIELDQNLIDQILNGKVTKAFFNKYINFVDINYMIKLIYKWFEENHSAEIKNLEPYHNEVNLKFSELVVFNFNREKKESLKGLSIRHFPKTEGEHIIYSFGSVKWVEFLKLVYEIK